MDPHMLETYRQRLLGLQQQLVQRIFDMEDTMLAMDADRDIERTDRVQEEAAEWRSPPSTSRGGGRWLRSRMLWLGSMLAPMGICDTCGETISAERLTAMPMARRCVSCQERLEHRSTRT